MLQVAVFLALAFSIVIAIFAVQNTTAVTVTFLMLRAESVAVSVLVLVSAALGAGVMLLLGTAREIRLRLKQRSLNQQLRTAERRVEELERRSAAPATSEPAGPALALPSDAGKTEPLPSLESGSVDPLDRDRP